jgi:hypothetical protein
VKIHGFSRVSQTLWREAVAPTGIGVLGIALQAAPARRAKNDPCNIWLTVGRNSDAVPTDSHRKALVLLWVGLPRRRRTQGAQDKRHPTGQETSISGIHATL